MTTPEKCIGCKHTIIQLEAVHDGWCKYHIDIVVRCDCFPAHYKVGCVCAEIYCEKKLKREPQESEEK